MSARVIDGKALAADIRRETAEAVQQLRAEGCPVRLDAIVAGQSQGALIYARSQETRCAEVGIDYHAHFLPDDCDDEQILRTLNELNTDPKVTGILVNLPLPPGVDSAAIQYHIDPYKDVEGVNPGNIGLLFYRCPIIAPCTALAVMEILNRASCEPRSKHAVVVGQGVIAGKPVTLFLIEQFATVTACHKATVDIEHHTRHADILIVATGVPGLIKADHVKPGAVVIDVGINRIPDGQGGHVTVGDVDYESVCEVAGAITPVPGGVGPVTVAMLLRSTVEAARKQRGHRRPIQ